MKKNSRGLFLALSVFIGVNLYGEPAISSTISASEINLSGRQRMLSQRMVKAYCLIGQDIQAETYKVQLLESINQFDNALHELIKKAPTQEIRDTLSRTEAAWKPFKQIVGEQPTRDGAKKLIQLDEDLLYSTEKVVLALQDYSNTPTARLVNVSGRQRMLSQRIAKFYMLKSWGFENASISSGLVQAKNEFEGALNELTRNPTNTPDLNMDLTMAQSQWNVLVHFIDREKDPMPLFMATTTEKVLMISEKLTAKYEKLIQGK
jgi:hypothetical protein